MKFIELELKGAYLIEFTKMEDERGYFARSWDRSEFLGKNLESSLVQCSVSFNHKKGTLRGMHFQAMPYAETKLVRCTRGALFDVMVDLRPDSPTFKRWAGITLTPDNGKMFYIPKGFAHGFETLEDRTEIAYQISEAYIPLAARGVRWNDPAFCIEWPLPVGVINKRDNEYPDFDPKTFQL